MGLALAVDAELFRLDAVVRWLDAADGRIKRFGGGLSLPAPPSMPKVLRRVGARR